MHLHPFVEIFLIGIASNLDNAGVGIAYGVRGIRIPWTANLIIALVSFLMTCLAGLSGDWLSNYISPSVGKLLGTILLVSVGVYVLIQPLLNNKTSPASPQTNLLTHILRQPEAADLDHSQTISSKESFLLGTALGINALAGGFDAGVIHLSVWATSLSVGVFSFILLGVTDHVGRKYIARKAGMSATLISGVLLILIGLHQVYPFL